MRSASRQGPGYQSYKPPSSTAERRFYMQMLEIVLCVACICSVWMLAETITSAWWSIAALFIFCWLCFMLFRLEPRGTALLLPIVTYRFSVVISLAFIEFGAEIPELGTFGRPGTHTISYVFYMAIMFGSFALFFRPMASMLAPNPNSIITRLFDRHASLLGLFVVAFAGIATLILIFQGLRTGFPLLTGTDRFLFRRMIADPITANILAFKSLICFPLGVVAFAVPAPRLIRIGAIVVFAVFLLINFLFGDKFFIIIAAALSFFAAYIFINYQTVRRHLGKFCLIAVICVSPLFALTYFIYSGGGRESVEHTVQRMGGRIAGQGELWYLQNSLGAPAFNWDADFVRRNIQALAMRDMNYPLRASIGPAYFSNRYAPDRIRASMQRQGGRVTYTMAMEPLGLAVLGWGGLALMMAGVGGLVAFFSGFYARAITGRSVISAFFAGYLEQLVRSMTSQGAPWVLFGFSVLKWLFVVVAIEIMMVVAAYIFAPRPHTRRFVSPEAASSGR